MKPQHDKPEGNKPSSNDSRFNDPRSLLISHFTPSLMAASVLETMFVGRETLAARLQELIRSSTQSAAKQHTLLIAPRGLGKTHLLALTYHRVQADAEAREQLRVAWLREEEWGITSFLDFLLRIFRSLEAQYPGEVPAEELESIYDLDAAGAEAKVLRLLREFVGKNTLLLLLENLDEVFAGLGDAGQKRWRAWLQENSFCSTIATAPSLFNGVSLRDSPFFGFFRVLHLEPLSLPDAVLLLRHLAQLRGDVELAQYLLTPSGRARVRAIHYLAGGNPRIYVLFSQFLTRSTLDELLAPFLKLLDELTPYYQSRMQLLSPQQRKIVEFLCDHRGAAPVKFIATRGFMTHQTTSGQLADLKDKGYVVSQTVGRESFYELREPLMRLCIEVKKNRGEPIGLLVDFLRLWYSTLELENHLDALRAEAQLERDYIQYALEKLSQDPLDPRFKICLDDFNVLSAQEDWNSALQVAEEIEELGFGEVAPVLQALCYSKMERYEEALPFYNAAIHNGTLYNGTIHNRVINGVIASHSFQTLTSAVFCGRGAALKELGRYEEALVDLNRAVTMALAEDSPDETAFCLVQRAQTLEALSREEEALRDLEQACDLAPERKALWLYRGFLLSRWRRLEEALVCLRQVEFLGEETAELFLEMGSALFHLFAFDEALLYFEKALALEPSFAPAWQGKCSLLEELLRYEEALEALETFSTLAVPAFQWLYPRSRIRLARREFPQFQSDLEKALTDVTVRSRSDERVLVLESVQLYALLRTLWREVPPSAWKQSLDILVAVYLKNERSSALAQALMFNASSLLAGLKNVAGATPEWLDKTGRWLELWQNAVGEREDFALALRFLTVARRMTQTKDDRVMLELPAEERRLILELMGRMKTELTRPHFVVRPPYAFPVDEKRPSRSELVNP